MSWENVAIDPLTEVDVACWCVWRSRPERTSPTYYEQTDPQTGRVKSRSFYDEQGRAAKRQDFGDTHHDKQSGVT